MTQTETLTRDRDALLIDARALTADGADLEGDELARFEEIETEVEALNDKINRLARLEKLAADPKNLLPGTPFDVITRQDPYETPSKPESAGETRSRALAAVESWDASDDLKESATQTLQRVGQMADPSSGSSDVRGVAGHILRYSHPLYVSAFRKFARDPEGYQADLEPDERRAWQEAREYQRAVLQTSGAVLPSPLDPTVVLTNASAVDPMRSIARVDTTTSLTKRYITSAGSTFSFDAEVTEVSDDTFTETEVEITTRKAQGWIEASIEVWADQPGFDSEVAKIIADGKSRLEADKFITGLAASNEPIGLEGILDGGASEVAPATAEVFAAADVFNLIAQLPPRWRDRATFMAELSTINEIDQMETTNGAKLFPRVGDANPVLLRRRLVENSSVDAFSDVNVAATADNFILYVGDFGQYCILDRVGLSVHFIPPGVHVATANNLPDGKVGWYAYWRVGADSLVDDSFRVLNLATLV